ncbi:UDP-N-acetylmuramate dehydrogenase [Aquisalimonas asiatica]|uniref:UDP-N-acetylenolpyruvoylglucosamine reductase n=1 Tax=Aquisalimonas asiatica TaxID=406100 RepID=A0A1H8S7Z1_9GAMM|nr:UDP-N-acetylmuramate dehydrogenase [Aquisalimonas asiatica]SEO74647.1 UDP-N-acetylmuramate dehydrogenase [Aquisalimonas asiatica]
MAEALEHRGELRLQEPMARHTTWRVGGPADRFYRPADRDDLITFLRSLPEDEPVFWCGLGSNLLVRDGGLRGTVIFLQGGVDELRQLDATRVHADCGVACAKVARFAARQNLVGAEFLAGIPGTMGGALAMNAGAFGGETWEVVETVETMTRGGEVRRRSPGEYSVGYRSVEAPAEEWFLSCTLALQAGDGDAAMQRIRELLAQRAASQPIGKPSCGSVFRNPEGDHAARLIEAAGLKGARRGGAVVSDKHANFIINEGDATAADIEELVGAVRDAIAERFGVGLEAEVRIVGEARRTADD